MTHVCFVSRQPASNREDIKVFWDSITDLQRRLSRPRFARTSVLPEFRTAKVRMVCPGCRDRR